MDVPVRTTNVAKFCVRTRAQLAVLLGADEEFIAHVVADPRRFYTEFSIPKSNGDLRTIRPPRHVLRKTQRALLFELYRRVVPRSCVHGGVKGKSIVSHAQAHVGRNLVATLDIRKFYPSTTSDHLLPILAIVGFIGQAANDIVSLVTLENELPQGAPTSSLLANLAFAYGDDLFVKLCRPRDLRYSRYVDDIAISGDHDFRELRSAFVQTIERAGYSVAEEKVRFMHRHSRQLVTGLVVNDKLRPTREYIRTLQSDIRNCLTHGASMVAKCEGRTIRQLKDQLTGRVAHLRHVDGAKGDRLRGMLCGVNWTSSESAFTE